ncbi:MAG: hypothetical protein B7Z12_11690 [Caulobacter vibrioides]|uniref:PIN domain-containing protein n=1 Tax=Caulobacter vibrioides TaxID=155892 RepID=A0A258D5N8_CAUVI|nr:MAG: hypothetical protein B7Z12_11690 [Caulobacter vibrioides]
MRTVILVDTCIFLNVLDVPAFNQDRDATLTKLGQLARSDANLLLPFAAIVETGNHIAQLADGNQRRVYALKFVRQVQAAIAGEAPWTPTQSVDTETVGSWLNEFPDHAMRGIGLGDLSIIKEWEAACKRHPNYRVYIWSLDGGLTGYDRAARII